VSESRLLRRMFGTNREERRSVWSKLYNFFVILAQCKLNHEIKKDEVGVACYKIGGEDK
jgi:hypothetical protein